MQGRVSSGGDAKCDELPHGDMPRGGQAAHAKQEESLYKLIHKHKELRDTGLVVGKGKRQVMTVGIVKSRLAL